MSILVESRPYTITQVITNPGAVTNLVLHAHASRPLVVIQAKITLAQATIPTSANARVRLVRKTAAGTYTAIAATGFVNHGPGDADAGFTAGHTATVEGTDGDFLEEGWGATTGWMWNWEPTPEAYIVLPVGVANGIAIKHNVAPPAGNYAFQLTAHELAV